MGDDLKYILNEKNKYITAEYVEGVLKKYGIKMKVKNIGYFQQAMIHLSYLIRDEKFYKNNKTKPYQIQSNDIEPLDDLSKAIPLQPLSYERLEFLGDATIHNILAEYEFKRYPDEGEGFMTKLRTKIENSDSLCNLSRIIGLSEYVIISRYVELNGGRETNKAILEDSFEAFMGALYLDAGFEICRQFLIALIEREIDFALLLHTETNFKERLLQYFHLRRYCDPVYFCTDLSGPANNKTYTMCVKCRKNEHDEGSIVGIASASSKKQGEQLAAFQALIHFGVINEYDGAEDEIEEINSDEDSLSEYESNDEDEEENELICKNCKKEFKTKANCDKHKLKCK